MHGLISAIAGAGLAVAVSLAAGRAVSRWKGLPWAVHFTVGCAVMSVAVFGLLSVQAAKPGAFLGLAVLAFLAAWKLKPLDGPEDDARAGCFGKTVWTAVAAIFGGYYLIHALAPEIQPDSLSYHLSLPFEARRTGGFPIDINFFNIMPQGAESLFAMAAAFGREQGAKLFHLAALAAGCSLIIAIGARLCGDPGSGVLAAIWFGVTPVVGLDASCTYNDVALALAGLSVFYLISRWWTDPNGHLLVLAGLCAGFCYAVKFTGGLFAFAGMAAVWYRGGFADGLRYATAAAVVALPWVLRATWLTGDPVAPLFAVWFPNPYFSTESEKLLTQYLTSYGTGWRQIPLELTVKGGLLQGLLGPAWLLAPLGLISLRSGAGRALWLGAAVAVAPWFFNTGTRFLIPALPLVALALLAGLPRPVAVAVTGIHCLLSLPGIVDRYADINAWKFNPLPWKAALGLEDGGAYRRRLTVEGNLAALLESRTSGRDQILDLVDAPAALSQRRLVNNWQTGTGFRLLKTFVFAAKPEHGTLVEWRCKFSSQIPDTVHVTLLENQPGSWTVHEVRFEAADGRRIPAQRSWQVSASRDWWNAPLALDGNLASSWSTAGAAPAGTYLEIAPGARTEATTIRIISSGLAKIGVEGADITGPVHLPGLNLRSEAVREAKSAGIRFVLSRQGTDALGALGTDLAARPSDWGLKPVGAYEEYSLFEIR